MSKLVSCSICYKPVESKKTAVIEHQRVCHDCKSEMAREGEKWGR